MGTRTDRALDPDEIDEDVRAIVEKLTAAGLDVQPPASADQPGLLKITNPVNMHYAAVTVEDEVTYWKYWGEVGDDIEPDAVAELLLRVFASGADDRVDAPGEDSGDG
jgi:hypothetical protein